MYVIMCRLNDLAWLRKEDKDGASNVLDSCRGVSNNVRRESQEMG